MSLNQSGTILKLPLSVRVMVYLGLMLIGVVLRTYITHNITIVWIVNLIGLIVLFFPYIRLLDASIALPSVIYMISGLITLFVNIDYLSGSIKALGTNVNILVLPVMLNISVSKFTRQELDRKALIRILKFLSLLGTLSFLYAWLVDYSDILRVFGGTSAYKVNVSGLFYSKNIYGAFVSLTLAADLYLLTIEKESKRYIIIIGKMLAVVISFSRAALLQAGVMTFIFFWFKKRRTGKDYLLLFLSIAGVIAAIMYIRSNPRLYLFVYNSVFRVSSGDAGRAMLRNQAIEKVYGSAIKSIFGVGFAGMDLLNIDIDNTYLYLWFTGGIFKVLFYLSVLIKSVSQIIKLKGKDEDLFRICLAIFVSYAFFAYFESVAILELGLLNFVFTLFMFIIPFSLNFDEGIEIAGY